jgi:hypothetical protein
MLLGCSNKKDVTPLPVRPVYQFQMNDKTPTLSLPTNHFSLGSQKKRRRTNTSTATTIHNNKYYYFYLEYFNISLSINDNNIEHHILQKEYNIYNNTNKYETFNGKCKTEINNETYNITTHSQSNIVGTGTGTGTGTTIIVTSTTTTTTTIVIINYNTILIFYVSSCIYCTVR